MAQYIAHDLNGTIWGLGSTPQAAREDAHNELRVNDENPVGDNLIVRACTPALAKQIERDGGNIAWEQQDDGTADTEVEP